MFFNLAMIPNMIGSCAATSEVGDRAPNPSLKRNHNGVRHLSAISIRAVRRPPLRVAQLKRQASQVALARVAPPWNDLC